jgi:hypothetical protein
MFFIFFWGEVMDYIINVYNSGAVGDGITDDTAAVRSAVSEACKTGKTVWFPPGKFLCGEIKLYEGVYLKGGSAWGYRDTDMGRVQLLQKDISQECLLDITHAYGAVIDGLSLVGTREGNCVGILSRDKGNYSKENAYKIQNCKISLFGSHGVFLNQVWCFSVRHCMSGGNGGDGIKISGWDGFVLDNWFSGNRGSGFNGTGHTAAVTLTGNRIEWNKECGIILGEADHYNITGNYIDRSGGAGIKITAHSSYITCTGNVLYRNGKFGGGGRDNAHIVITDSGNLVVTGNTMSIGKDDGGTGVLSPQKGILIKGLTKSVIADNIINAVLVPFDDLGCHGKSVIVENNV